MSTDHPLITAASAEAGLVKNTLLDAFLKRMPYVVGATETLGDLAQSIGSTPLSILNAATGAVFFYDDTDTTTVDDGVTCLVDGNGHRYKLSDSSSLQISSVLAMQNSPPGSPSIGDAYVVDTVPTGAWVGHAKDIAYYSKRGWIFAVPAVGHALLNQATGGNIQYTASAVWSGLAPSLTDASVYPRALYFAMGLPVESKLNTPPVSPSANLYYIVDTAPTGAWTGQAGKIAFYQSAAWVFLAPYEGARVFLKSIGEQWQYVSGVWVTSVGVNGLWTTVKKTADESTSADTTLSSDALLKFTMAANTKYSIRLKVFFTTTATADFKYGLTGPSSPTLVIIHRKDVSATAVSEQSNEASYTSSASIVGTQTQGYIEFDLIVQNGANAGVFAFTWAQATSDATANSTTVRAGSYLEYLTI